MVKRWRQLTVWLHILTSVGWMAQAMALCVLLSVGLAGAGTSATAMAQALDGRLLAPMANGSALTGIVLAAATPWGFFLNWWVVTKFAVSLIQLYAGIFLLSPQLAASVTAGPRVTQVVATALMASAIAFQGWLSVAKPWGRIERRRHVRHQPAPAWVFAVTVLAGLGDLGVALALGHPLPLLSVTVLVVILARRRRWLGGRRGPDRPAVA
ncbi:hypothetical protein [Mangrovihabitans endophyticus]|uniref:Uncharacterized protein n=1 Tax=Mangrovihabitans endophyticus TaxID=1751298 RepID=A0A8J3BXC7_9ACTN|nr:hypothetical protein [Mangrovihabitans endophyticus]GGK78409.1 hypothetical protein GCM10012284_10390 [Mangrovihabitans endophyticus]